MHRPHALAVTLKQTAVFNTSPGASESGIWQSDNAPASDESGAVYVTTGNGKFAPGREYGDSILKLALEGDHLVVRDGFTPADQETLNRRDLDTGSGGPLLTPAGLLLAGGKDGTLYFIDRKKMSQPIKRIDFRGGIYAAPAYWNGHVYVLASQDYLTDFAVKGGLRRLVAQRIPTVANVRVYVEAKGELDVYGLFSATVNGAVGRMNSLVHGFSPHHEVSSGWPLGEPADAAACELLRGGLQTERSIRCGQITDGFQWSWGA